MPHCTVDAPISLDFGALTELRVRLIAGTVAVRVTGDRPSVVVSDITGRPLQVSHEAIRTEFGSLRPVTPYWSHTVSGNVAEGSGTVSVNSVSGAVTLLRRPRRRTAPRTQPPCAEAEMESETR